MIELAVKRRIRMRVNPYTSPNVVSQEPFPVRMLVSPIFFLAAAFVSGWIVFYVAYLVNGFGYGYLNFRSGIDLVGPIFRESLVVASVVSALAAAPFLENTSVSKKNYCILAAICLLEFAMAYWFFVAFFEI